MASDVFNIGILGYGKVGQIRRKILDTRPDCRVVRVADPKYTQTRKLNGCIYSGDGEALLADPGVDAVFVCAPNAFMKQGVVQALDRGKHVFCEKPPGACLQDTLDMREAEQRSGDLKLKFGFNHRYHYAVMELKKRIDSGAFGDILWMRGRYGKSVDKNYLNTWRAKRALAGGGILLDQGIHMLDLFLYLCGPFHKVKSLCSNHYWNLDTEDNAFVILQNNKGQQASLHSTMTQWRHLFALEVFLERGYMVINGFVTPSKTYGVESLTVAVNRSEVPRATHSMEEDIYYKRDDSWKLEIDEFMDAIKHNRAIQHGHSQDALNIMDHLDRIYRESGFHLGTQPKSKTAAIGIA